MDYKSVGEELIAFVNVLKRNMDKECDQNKMSGLSAPNAKFVIYLIRHRDDEIYQKTLEEAFSLRPSTVSRSLKMLEKDGYIRRISAACDSRLKRVVLTKKSLELGSAFENNMNGIFHRMAVGVTDEELGEFISTLSKMKYNLTGE